MTVTFIKDLDLEKIEGLLDSEESVRNARLSLEQNTEDAYRMFEAAKRTVQEAAHKKLLD